MVGRVDHTPRVRPGNAHEAAHRGGAWGQELRMILPAGGERRFPCTRPGSQTSPAPRDEAWNGAEGAGCPLSSPFPARTDLLPNALWGSPSACIPSALTSSATALLCLHSLCHCPPLPAPPLPLPLSACTPSAHTLSAAAPGLGERWHQPRSCAGWEWVRVWGSGPSPECPCSVGEVASRSAALRAQLLLLRGQRHRG